MSVRDVYDIDPTVCAQESDRMMPKVMAKLEKFSTDEDKFIYTKEKLDKHFTNNNITKVLAFIDCYQGNTGEDAKDLITKYLSDFELPNSLADTKEDLMGIIKIYFP